MRILFKAWLCALMAFMACADGAFAANDVTDLLYSFYAGFDALADTPDWDSAKRQTLFGIAKNDLGLNYLKVNIKWDSIEPQQAVNNWAVTDDLAQYAETHNLSIIPMFTQQGTPLWAQRTSLPDGIDVTACRDVTRITDDPDYFSDFVHAFLEKYKTRMSIKYIELENEPNGICLWPDTPQYLAEVDNAVVARIKTSPDPEVRGVKVCSASFHQPVGLDSTGHFTRLAEDHAYSETFAEGYLTYLTREIDCFSLHDYGRIGFTEEDTVYKYASQYDLESNYRTQLDQFGFQNTALIFTECAYDRKLQFKGDENYAAAYMIQGYVLSHAKGIAQGRWCQAVSAGPQKAMADYGIADITGTAPIYYAGYYAFQVLRQMMLTYSNRVQHVAGQTNDDNYWVEKFADSAGNSLYIAFVPIRFDTATSQPKFPPPAAQTATINIGTGKVANITSLKGIKSSMTADNSGNITLTVGGAPLYIEVSGTPAISASPAVKDFGSVNTGSSSAAQTFTVTNTGDGNLSVGSLGISGTNADQFKLENDGCTGRTMPPSGTCTVQAVFSPTSTGSKSASLNISHNASGSPTVINLTGQSILQVLHSIATDAGPGGAIMCTPNPVDDGSASACTITSDTGYSIASVTVDGIVQAPAPNSYTFSNVTSDHSISATFATALSPSAYVLATQLANNALFKIDPATGQITSQINFSDGNVGRPAADFSRRLAYLPVNNKLIALKPDTMEFEELVLSGVTLGLNGSFAASGLDGRTVAVLNHGADGRRSLDDRLDILTLNPDVWPPAPTAHFSVVVGQQPIRTLIDHNSRYAIVSVRDDAKILVIDLATHQTVVELAPPTIPAGSEPEGMDLHPTQNVAYVTLHGANKIVIIDLDTNPPQMIGTVGISSAKGSPQPSGGNFTPDGGRFYVSAQVTNEILLFDTANVTSPVQDTTFSLPSSQQPHDIVYFPDERAYVANTYNGQTHGSISVMENYNGTASMSQTILNDVILNPLYLVYFPAAAPNIAISPDSTDFGSVNAGSPSAARVFTVTNTGTNGISISAISITGTDQGEFSKQSDNCSGQILSPSGGSCTVQVVFLPTSSGTKTATLQISSTNPVVPTLTVSLTGTGLPQYSLTISGVAGSSTGTVAGGSGINCTIAVNGSTSGSCTELHDPGSSITLTATPAACASVSWTSCPESSGNSCIATLSGNLMVTATFNDILPVRISKVSPDYYPSIQDAYYAAAGGDLIQATAHDITGDLDLNQDIPVTFDGGYDCHYTGKTGTTLLQGMVTVSKGTFTVSDIAIR